MIFEAWLWWSLSAVDAMTLPVEWLVPDEWTLYLRQQIARWGPGLAGVAFQFASPTAVGAFLTMAQIWVVVLLVWGLARLYRAVRSWLP